MRQSESVGVGPAAGGADAHAARPPGAESGPAHQRDELPEKGHVLRRRRAVVLGRARAKVPVAVTHAIKHALIRRGAWYPTCQGAWNVHLALTQLHWTVARVPEGRHHEPPISGGRCPRDQHRVAATKLHDCASQRPPGGTDHHPNANATASRGLRRERVRSKRASGRYRKHHPDGRVTGRGRKR